MLAGAATVPILLFAYHLSRKYLQDYVCYYFYHLLLSCLLALMGKPFPVLTTGLIHLKGLQADQFFLLFDRLLAKPLWIASLFFLLKCIAAMAGKKPSRPFIAGYFIFFGGYLILAWLFMIQFFQTGQTSAHAETFSRLNYYFETLAAMSIYAFGIIRSFGIRDRLRQSGLRTFCLIGFMAKAFFWILIFLSFSFTLPFLVGVSLPLPALIYLAAFLKKSSPLSLMPSENTASLESFYAKFNITPREREIIGLICSGRGNQAIANHLFISIHTVKRHVNQIYQKVRVRNRVQLANAVRAFLDLPHSPGTS